MGVLHSISRLRLQREGDLVYKGYRKHEATDEISLGLFARALVGGTKGVLIQREAPSLKHKYSHNHARIDVIFPSSYERNLERHI